MKVHKIIFVLLIILLLSSCSGTYRSKLDFNPNESIRVAVLPFVSKNEKGEIINEEGRIFVDNLSFISSKNDLTPAQLVRTTVISELKKTSLDLVSTALIDIDLPHHGYANNDGTLNIEKVLETPPAQLCSSFLSCDAVLYGTITRWDRSYYGIESVNSVGIELSLISARDGSTLFSSKGEDNERRGISKIPTGFSSIFLEPIKGLDSEIIVNLSNRIVSKILEPLVVSKRPQFIDTSPPAIFASSHDGKNREISDKEPLVVVLYGSESTKASFSIGTAVDSIPMIERTPGHFYGEYIPLKTDKFSNQPVRVSLTDSSGRTSFSETPGGLISYP